MIRVNLLAVSPGSAPPREWLPREQRSAIVGLSLLILTGIGVGGWWWYLKQQHAAVEAKIEAANTELTRLKAVAVLVERATTRRTELTERLALIERLRATQRGPVSLLETLSRALPDGLWLMEIKQTGSAIQLEGRAMSERWVADFAEFLQNSGLFKRPVEIVTTLEEAVEDQAVVRFVMKAEAAPPAVEKAVTAVTSAAPAGAPATSGPAAPQPGTPPSSGPATAPETPAPVPAATPASTSTPPPAGGTTNAGSGGSGF
jgi:type IV pilus assembly protein PilN